MNYIKLTNCFEFLPSINVLKRKCKNNEIFRCYFALAKSRRLFCPTNSPVKFLF